MANKKRSSPYVPSNDVKYGMKPLKAAQSQAVIGLKCRFCYTFGREEKIGSKRKPTSNVQAWSPPFRYDNIELHLTKQHPAKWAVYNGFQNEQQREAFFEENGEVYRNTLSSHFVLETAGERSLIFELDKGIVETIIGEMFFKPDDLGEEELSQDEELDELAAELSTVVARRREAAARAKELALNIFKLNIAQLPEAQAESEDEETSYTVTIPRSKAKLFSLVTRYVSCGTSFRQTSKIISMTYEVMQDPILRSCPPRLVCTYVRVACAVNLQRIKDLLSDAWAFSMALDSATHQSRSYLDVRIRVFVSKRQWNVFNFHLAALPMHERHTGEVMFLMIVKLFDVVCPEWKTKLLGVSSDGARNMTGRFAGVVTRLGKALAQNCELIRIWCGAHQLDLVIQHVMDTVVKENFFSVMTAFISHLGRQQILAASMEATCPRVVNRWLSTDKVTRWFKQKRPELLHYIEDKSPETAPPDIWWIYLLAMEAFTSHSAKAFRKIQGLTTLISQQDAELKQLISNLIHEVGAIGPLTDEAVGALDLSRYVVSGHYAVLLDNIREFALGLASWTDAIISQADANEVHELLEDIGKAFIVACDRIDNIVVERNADNSASHGPSSLPPVLPHELVKISAAEFIRKARSQSTRLESYSSAAKIDVIADQHKELLRAYRSEPVLQSSIDSFNGKTSFEAAWGPLGSRFIDLCEFCGCIATIFPGTATVESDFSVLRWEKDNFRKSLSDFGLEAVMQTKQYCELETLVLCE